MTIVLQDKKATCFPSVEKYLRNGGAIVQNQDVVRDGKIITAVGPEAAKEFAKAIVSAME
jgi:4-methyl-5(b-hydroxyethyl)-thiazole monophosphate biosynthesis